MARANVLFAMADQLRWDAQGYANPNATGVHTPALDRIATEGMRVRFSWSSTPTCTPARAALLTGRRPWGHGMLGYGEVAQHYPLVFPRLLRDAGYTTVSIGKDHFGWNVSSDSGIAHGYQQTILYDGLGSWTNGSAHHWSGEWDDYDRWFAKQKPGADPTATLDDWNGWKGKAFVYDEKLHPTAWVGDHAVAFLRSFNQTGPPFLLKVSFHRPHSPYDPPARLLDQVQASDLGPMARCAGESQGRRCWSTRFRGNASAGDPKGCEVRPDAWCGLMPSAEATLGRRAYLASVAFVDEQVAKIYAALSDTGLLSSTFIVWTSDHGDGQGDHYHWRKGYPYEFSAHVPMLLRWPEVWDKSHAVRVARGATLNAPILTELRDVFHTIVDVAGLGPHVSTLSPTFDATDGKSMLCLLLDPSGATCDYAPNPGPWRSWIDLEHSTCYNMTNHWSALTDGTLKYVFKAWDGVEQLFNLSADPTEATDLASDGAYARVLAVWRQRMVHQFEEEQRGPDWVRGGKLVIRPNGQTYGPNYPQSPQAKPGDAVIMKPNGGGVACHTNDCWLLINQRTAWSSEAHARSDLAETALQLLGISGDPLCLARSSQASTAHTLVVGRCDHSSTDQRFSTRNHTAARRASSISAGGVARLTHTPSGLCVTAAEDSCPSCPATLAACASSGSANESRQLWLFGASGRLCATAYNSLCLHADAKWVFEGPAQP